MTQNWAGNYDYQAQNIHYPETVAELRAIVHQSRRLKALGTRHSFNAIADSDGDQVSLARLEPVVDIDSAGRTVTIGGGVTYGQLCPLLDAAGLALPNLASLPHISVAGAAATATHGSGVANGNLSSAVVGLTLVAADGNLVELNRAEQPGDFPGAVVNLGALGVVARLTLALEPAFTVAQVVYENLQLDRLLANFEAVTGRSYSVSLFTDWSGDVINQVWCKERRPAGGAVTSAGDLFGARPAGRHMHPIGGHDAVNCTPQLGQPGPWHERLPHFRHEFTPSSGAELQSEYFVPRQHGAAAIAAIAALGPAITPLLYISEIRTIAADDLWLSPCCQQDCLAIHFTWKPNWPAVRALLPRIEAALRPFAVRPHWGKLFTLAAADVAAAYPRLPDFRRLARRFDPDGKFHNAFLADYL